MIPWFIRFKVLDIYLWTKNNWKNKTAPGGGNKKMWLAQLKAAIEQPRIF
jgi:hypothetical protein